MERASIYYVKTIRRPTNKKFKRTEKSCAICLTQFSTLLDYTVHFDMHGEKFVIPFLENWKFTLKRFELSHNYDAQEPTTVFILKNINPITLIIKNAFLFHTTHHLLNISDDFLQLGSGEEVKIAVSTNIFDKINHKYSIIIISGNALHSREEYLEQYHFQVKKTLEKKVDKFEYPKSYEKPMVLSKMQVYDVPAEIKMLVKKNFTKDDKTVKSSYEVKKVSLNPANYTLLLRLINYIEDYSIMNEFEKYTIENVKLQEGNASGCYLITKDQFKTEPSELSVDNRVTIKVMSSYGSSYTIDGTISKIQINDLTIQMDKSVYRNNTYSISFHTNRFAFQTEYEALDMIENLRIENILFPKMRTTKFSSYSSFLLVLSYLIHYFTPIWLSEKCVFLARGITRFSNFTWFNENISKNNEQITAIKNILNETAFPAPYIMYGPPGSGKTATLVEAISQIWKLRTGAKILVTASSNFACNELANRLLKNISKNDIYRFFSKSVEKNAEDFSETLIERSNFNSGSYRLPSLSEIQECRIVICTLAACGRFVQAGLQSNFFRYLFIDECGSAKEISALIPISGVVTSFQKLNASIILSGDPLQLGPVIKSDIAEELGQGISLMERLMNSPIYQKTPETKKYNPALLTKLLKNYRSHENILKFSNDTFYDGELQAMAAPEITNWATNWKYLPKKNFPIIFDATIGNTMKDKKTSSSYNHKEIDVIRFYLDKIIKEGIDGRPVHESDIGIVSPYAAQVEKIKKMCNENHWDEVEVGSTEQYQGREKDIILISTVRSKMETVGFLENSRRLNVALTRARALMIVIGNPNTLQKDEHWYKFIKYCWDNGAITGTRFELLDEASIVKTIPTKKLNVNVAQVQQNAPTRLISNSGLYHRQPIYQINQHHVPVAVAPKVSWFKKLRNWFVNLFWF